MDTLFFWQDCLKTNFKNVARNYFLDLMAHWEKEKQRWKQAAHRIATCSY